MESAFPLTALDAFERVLEHGTGRLIEPFETYEVSPLMGGGTRLAADRSLPPPERLSCQGRGNHLIMGRGAKPPMRLRFNGTGNVLFLGPWSDASRAIFDLTATDGLIFVGAFTRLCANTSLMLRGQTGAITIGDHCLLGERIIASNSDGHAIYSRETRQRINPERDIAVGDRAFVGHDCRLAKGALIEPDGIVLHSSLVSGTVRGHCAYGGVPARLVQEGVAWAPGTADTLDEAQAAELQAKAERVEVLRTLMAGTVA